MCYITILNQCKKNNIYRLWVPGLKAVGITKNMEHGNNSQQVLAKIHDLSTMPADESSDRKLL